MSESDFCGLPGLKSWKRKYVNLARKTLAAFFAEPILGSGGVIVPPPEYNRRTWEVCRSNDILYVADEVVTGFGRLGHWFVSKDMFNVEPDIITCAKGLSSAYLPLGAVIFSDRIYGSTRKRRRSMVYGRQYLLRPPGLLCGCAEEYRDPGAGKPVRTTCAAVGAYFEEQLHTLLDLPIVGDIRGRLFMMCVVNVMNKETREFFPDESEPSANEFRIIARTLGVIVRPAADLNIMSPSLDDDPRRCGLCCIPAANRH